MTNKQKKEILDSVYILQKAHKEIDKAVKSKNSVRAQKILTECQEVAIAVGEYIEKFEGEGHVTIPYLEQYCEALFQVYEQLAEKQFLRCKNLCEEFKGQLAGIENSIRNDVCARMQVVFFPYKVSMWDSFESIYLTAKADKNCDVYCVPIPYYDRNPDKSFGQIHYEADKYPDYVEVTDWQSYDLENQSPDIAYIHNPYDEHNLVTSVHPGYYSYNLKKYIGTLVYIPYNVTGGMIGRMHRSLPAYYYVDKIIAQHERQIPFFDQDVLEKVSAFGSPKFDKVINLVVTEKMIPDEWKPKLRDKVFFLNTGINGLLKNGEKSLLKIQYILEVAERENVTLLWRPHPLLEATICSMRPELWETYVETVEKFCRYKNGILDRTENAELAIKLSDAYLGEPTSSISHMFGILGKPLFFINQGILEESREVENIKICCCIMDAADNQHLWACASGRNGLMKITESGKIEEYYIIPGEKDRSNLYSDILVNKGKLYLIPRNARQIAVFDIKNRQFTKIAIPKPGQKEKFNKGYLYEDKVYLIPRLYKKLVILNCASGDLIYNAGVVDELREITGIPDILVSANGSRLIGDSIYLAAPNKPYILEYDLRSLRSRIHKVPGSQTGFCCMEQVLNKIVLGSLDGCEIVVWDPQRGASRIIREFPRGWNKEEEICFWDIVELKGNAYIFPRKSPMILKLSIKDFILTAVEKDFPFSTENRKSPFYNHPDHFLMVKKLINGNVAVQDANRHGLSKFLTDGTFEWKQVALTEKDELKAFGDSFSKQGGNLPWGIYESKYYSVRRLILYVCQKLHNEDRQKEAFSCVAANLDGTAGQKIYTFISEVSEKKLHDDRRDIYEAGSV